MTPDITPDELRRMFREHEQAMNRLVKSTVQPLKDQADRIERQVVATNGRVSHLEAWRIEHNARVSQRAEDAKLAAEVVATKAAEALEKSQHSRQWWLGVIGICIAAVSVSTPLVSALFHHIVF